jgi:hypothetical protein
VQKAVSLRHFKHTTDPTGGVGGGVGAVVIVGGTGEVPDPGVSPSLTAVFCWELTGGLYCGLSTFNHLIGL